MTVIFTVSRGRSAGGRIDEQKVQVTGVGRVGNKRKRIGIADLIQ